MKRFSLRPLKIVPQIYLDQETFYLDEELNKECDLIWEKAKEKNPSLFNGKIISLVSYENNTILCQEIEYKVFIAQNLNKKLRDNLKILPLGISAMTFIDDKIIVGKRSSQVFMNPLHFENAPAGSIEKDLFENNKLKIQKQVFKELHEEIGFLEEHIITITPLCVSQDHSMNYADITFKIVVNPKYSKEMMEANSEYECIQALNSEELKKHIATHQYVPLSKYLLENWWKI